MAWPWHVLCILNTSGLWLELKFILQQQLKDRSRSGAVVQGNVQARKERKKPRASKRKFSCEKVRLRQHWEDETGKGGLGGSAVGPAPRLHSDISSLILHGESISLCMARASSPSALPVCHTLGQCPLWELNQLQAWKMGVKPHCFSCSLKNTGIWCSHLQAGTDLPAGCSSAFAMLTISAGEGSHGQLSHRTWSKVRPSHLMLIKPCFQYDLFLKVSC